MSHILLVSNYADTHALRAALQQAGHQVTEAADGPTAQALAALGTEPLVVLLDEGMPPLGGNALLMQCQELGGARAPRELLLLSDHPDRVPPPFQGPRMRQLVPTVAWSRDAGPVLAAVAAAATRLNRSA
jgi:CheY-like chemotaxis protein